jgi:hypothetical protein
VKTNGTGFPSQMPPARGVMTMLLKNSNEIAPVFNNTLLSLNSGENDDLILSMPRPEIKKTLSQ